MAHDRWSSSRSHTHTIAARVVVVVVVVVVGVAVIELGALLLLLAGWPGPCAVHTKFACGSLTKIVSRYGRYTVCKCERVCACVRVVYDLVRALSQ